MRAPNRSPLFRSFAVALLVALVPALAHALDDTEPKVSTAPIGSPFYRHLAFDLNVDLHELVKFERRGFGRSEIVTLVLVSRATGAPLKDYGRRRLKDDVKLRDLATEAGLDYPTLYKVSQAIKQSIEAKGDKNLPPPLFEAPPADENAPAKKKKKGAEASPSPSSAPSPSAAPSPSIAPSPAPIPGAGAGQQKEHP